MNSSLLMSGPTVIAEPSVETALARIAFELVRARPGAAIAVDLSGLELIDGASLRTLETLCSRLGARGVDVVVVAPDESPVGRIVAFHRLDETVTVVESAALARAGRVRPSISSAA